MTLAPRINNLFLSVVQCHAGKMTKLTKYKAIIMKIHLTN